MSTILAGDDSWAETVCLELQQEAARRLNVDVANVKPCFARIGRVAEGSRNSTAFMYGTELRRMGVAEATAWDEMCRWNDLCRPPLPERELRSAFESAWAKRKTYGCRGALASAWCIGRHNCDWFKQNVAGRRKSRETDFFDFGWPALLKSREALVYLALVRLESARGVGAGALVIAGTRDYAALAGVHRRHIVSALEALEARGLLVVLERGEALCS